MFFQVVFFLLQKWHFFLKNHNGIQTIKTNVGLVYRFTPSIHIIINNGNKDPISLYEWKQYQPYQFGRDVIILVQPCTNSQEEILPFFATKSTTFFSGIEHFHKFLCCVVLVKNDQLIKTFLVEFCLVVSNSCMFHQFFFLDVY